MDTERQELNLWDFRFRHCLILQITATRSMLLEVICLPPSPTHPMRSIDHGAVKKQGSGMSSTFSLWHISEAVQWVWIKRLDVFEKAITQEKRLRAAEGLLRGHLRQTPFLFFPGIWSIATDWKPIGRETKVMANLCLEIHPLGVRRPSNITQPFDLSTWTRPSPAVMDGFLCTVQVLWFIERYKYLLFDSRLFIFDRSTLYFCAHLFLSISNTPEKSTLMEIYRWVW